MAVGQTMRACRDPPEKKTEPLAYRLSSSLKVIERDTYRSDTYDLLFVINKNNDYHQYRLQHNRDKLFIPWVFYPPPPQHYSNTSNRVVQ